jgi:hypothetical protein
MADNTLPPGGLSGADPVDSAARRTFLRRAVGIGVPVVLATVPGRTVLAQEPGPFSGGCASTHLSGWRARNPDLEAQCDQQLAEPAGIHKPGGFFEEEMDSDSLKKTHGASNSQVNPGQ